MRIVLLVVAALSVGCSALVTFDRSLIDDGGVDGGGVADAGDAGFDGGQGPCDTTTHQGCRDSELRRAEGGGDPTCVGAGATQCEACGDPCDAAAADMCTDRVCTCGSSPACSGDTPFCAGSECVACRNDTDCTNALMAQCVEGACRPCDPDDNSGCMSNTPICDETSITCVGCEQTPVDTCPPGLECQLTGACGCSDDDECTTPTTPICDNATDVCVGCDGSDSACMAAGAGDFCLTDGSCADCNPADNDGCMGAMPICRSSGGTTACAACVPSDCSGGTPVCATSGTNIGRCVVCTSTDDSACGAGQVCGANNTCVECNGTGLSGDCPASEPVCDANNCRDCTGAECGVMQCVSGATDPADNGSCAACNPATHAGCAAAATARCDPGSLTCAACTADPQCTHIDSSFICVSGVCQRCNATTHAGCANPTPICLTGTSCRMCMGGDTCPGGGTCTAGLCVLEECTVLTQDVDCPGEQVCSPTGTCVDCNDPIDCVGSDFACTSGSCVCNRETGGGPARCRCDDDDSMTDDGIQCAITEVCNRSNGMCE